jgi:hypothetical protein
MKLADWSKVTFLRALGILSEGQSVDGETDAAQDEGRFC